ALIEDTIGGRLRLFRPPFGGRNPLLFRVTRDLGLTPALWNVNTRDWKAKSAGEIEARIHDGLARNRSRKRGSNILMHDGSHLEIGTDRRRTVNATANLLGTTHDSVRFVTLDQWCAP
ncbi:MAG TPA: polysaccharide deacetylase family protein, partial [Acidobacteriaceae bacterium]